MIENETTETQKTTPLLLKTGDLLAMLQIRRTKLYALLSSERIPPPIRLGRELRWRADLIRDWIEQGCPAADRMIRNRRPKAGGHSGKGAA